MIRLRKAAVWAVASALFAAIWFARYESHVRAQGQMIPVVVAAHDLPEHFLLTPLALSVHEMPLAFVPPGALQTIGDVVGLVTQTKIAAGEPITATRVVAASTSAALSAMLTAGLRAVTIPVNAVTGVAGLIHPNDRVDLLAQFEVGTAETAQPQVFTILQRVPVIAVGREIADVVRPHVVASDASEAGNDARAHDANTTTLTLAVAPDDVQRIVFALGNGALHVALAATAEENAPPPLTPATAASVTGSSSLVRRRDYRGK